MVTNTKEYMREWFKNHPESREHYKKTKKKWNQKHLNRYNGNATRTPEQWRAQQIAEKYCFVAPKCLSCGSIENRIRHHPDYSKPLEVVTLCASCHNFIHKGVS